MSRVITSADIDRLEQRLAALTVHFSSLGGRVAELEQKVANLKPAVVAEQFEQELFDGLRTPAAAGDDSSGG